MSNECKLKTSIGGQALLEGIMMRGPKRSAMAVRHLNGEIILEEWDTVGKKPAKFFTLPLIRGAYNMITSMSQGYRCMLRSAELSGLDELEAEEEREKELRKLNKKRKKDGLPPLEALPEETEKKEAEQFDTKRRSAEAAEATEEPSVKASETAENFEEPFVEDQATATPVQESVSASSAPVQKKQEKKSNSSVLVAGAAIVGSVLGIALSILLFIFLPSQIYSWTLQGAIDGNIGVPYLQMLVRSLFEGVLRIAIFVCYMWAVSLMKDIRRTFEYHGAEHKTIFCYEAGLPLTVENVRKMGRFHPRCGTSFMIVMLIIGIIIGSFIPDFGLEIELLNNLLRSLCKLALLPLTVGLGYEFIRYAGRHDNLLVKILSAPGLWMQRISVKEPDDGMIECAIAAMKRVIPDDGSDKI